MTDQPLKPPTHAMWVKRNFKDDFLSSKGFAQFLNAVTSLHKDLNFLLCTIGLNITYCLGIVLYLHITVIIRQFKFKTMRIYLSNEILGGITIVMYAIAKMISGVVSAKISNKWKNYVGQALLGSVVTFLSLVGLTLGFYFRQYILFCIFVILYPFGTRIFIIPLLEVITRHTYPIDETFVSVWVGANSSLLFLIIGEIARIISLYAPSLALLLFMCVCAFISFFITNIINPKDKRREIDLELEMQENNSGEGVLPLLTEEQR